jgi:hypothetical protein
MSFIDTDKFYNCGSDYIQKIQSKLKNTFLERCFVVMGKGNRKGTKF